MTMSLIRWLLIALLSFGLSLGWSCGGWVRSAQATAPSPRLQRVEPQLQLQSGKFFYDAGQFSQAAAVLHKAAQAYRGQPLNQSRALGLESLARQKLGQWKEAQSLLSQALALIPNNDDIALAPLLAQLWTTQGHLHLAQGQAKAALSAWQTAETYYRRMPSGDRQDSGILGVQINQAQAMQSLGFHNQASGLLKSIEKELQEQPDSILKLRGLSHLANLSQSRGELEAAQQLLETSLNLARQLKAPLDEAQVHLNLGNTARLKFGRSTEVSGEEFPRLAAIAIAHYQQAEKIAPAILLKTQAQLNRLSFLLEQGELDEVQALTVTIASQLPQLPPSRDSVYAQVNFAQSLIKQYSIDPELGKKSVSKARFNGNLIASVLETAIQQAQTLSDRRAESYAQGILGHWYETHQDWSQARSRTEVALNLSEEIEAEDIAYQWQWQLGRLLQQPLDNKTNSKGASEAAMARYRAAFDILENLRGELVGVNPDMQFSFRESVEPLYREWVDLLLRSGDASNQNLAQARAVIESLQLAELDNFFQEACISTQVVNIDQIDADAAVIYPILLPDRLETIVSLPGGQLRSYTQPISQAKIEAQISELRHRLILPVGQLFRPSSQQLYDWLIRPLEKDLAATQTKTLVFVLDGDLKNIPMGALSDGDRFLIERYSLALTPGLQLLEPQPLQSKSLGALTAGLSQARQGFAALPNVVQEVKQLEAELSAQVLLNEQFTVEDLAKAVNASSAPILHLATHGQFSSNKDETFILTWDERLRVDEFSRLLRNAELKQDSLIELLVLSACQTATGDRRAPLGLAGLAVRSGARSTMASLWLIDDEATAILMKDFYSALSSTNFTKAESLRQAQLQILENPQYRHPYYWSAFVLLGNWL